MKKAMWVFAPIMVAGSLLAGCLDDSITGTRPISFNLSATPSSAAAGEEISFQYSATGTMIQGVILNYGDGVVDSIFHGGSTVEASNVVPHTFTAVGTYMVIGRLETVSESRSDTVTVQVN